MATNETTIHGELIEIVRNISSSCSSVSRSAEDQARRAAPRTYIGEAFWKYVDMRPLEVLADEFLLFEAKHQGTFMFPDIYMQWYVADFFVLLGRLKEAVRLFPKLPLIALRRATNQLLSLKLAAGAVLSREDIFTLHGPLVTEFGQNHLERIVEHADRLLKQDFQNVGINRIQEWSEDLHSYYKYQLSIAQIPDYRYRFPRNSPFQPVGYGEFGHYYFRHNPDAVDLFDFHLSKKARRFIKHITNQAENAVREELGVTKIGEGWVSETQLYNDIREAFPHLEVIRHASPEWLRQQHLDIYIPELKVALEYHGRQHDEPIEFFGGQEAYERTQERDLRKLRLCRRHGVRLIHVRPGYVLDNVIVRIQEVSSKSATND